MNKLSYLKDEIWVEHSFSPVFNETTTDSGVRRICAGIPGSDTLPFEKLVLSLQSPYFLLYILHTSRGEGEEGRYQSPELSTEQFCTFMEKFGRFLSLDSRCDIWAFSPSENATIVWDRHNRLFAYGPIDQLTSELRSLGFVNGNVDIPNPHQHHFHPKLDDEATELLATFPWRYTPLQPEDEQ